MRWFMKHLRNVGIASISMLFFLTCLTSIPLSAASAHEEISEVATSTSVTLQATPTVDATVTVLTKEQLAQQIAEQQHTWDNWLWSNIAAILSSFLSTLVIVVGALLGFWRWRRDQHTELEKRAEERFQATVAGLGDEKEGARAGAAIMLRTFLQPSYGQFYQQSFDLAVTHLRLRHVEPDIPAPLDSLSQALITVFKESFLLARNRLGQREARFDKQSLDASHVRLDNAYLDGADFKGIWMRVASLKRIRLRAAKLNGANLRRTDLRWAYLNRANLSEANLSEANLSGANLSEANLSGSDLFRANLSEANLSGANLISANFSDVFHLSSDSDHRFDLSRVILAEVNLNAANLSGADLTGTNIENALSLKNTNLRGVKGLTKEQLATCKAKGAIIDEDLTTSSSQSTSAPSSPPQSSDTQASMTPPQESTPPPDPDGSSTASSQQDPESQN